MRQFVNMHTEEDVQEYLNYEPPARPIKFASVDLRDGQQSLIATRMKTGDVVRAIGMMDQVGFDSIEMWGGATFDACIRFLHEDPFERLRLCKKAAPNTPLRMLLRGQNVVGYRQYADDIVERFVSAAAEDGIDVFLIFDGLMDTRNCEAAAKAALKTGRRVEGNLLYTTSPAHNDALYCDVAKRFVDMGMTAVHLEDMAGMKDPISTFHTIRALKNTVDVPIHYHSHCTGGMADMCYWAAVHAGVDVLDTDFSAFCHGTAHPALESMVTALSQTPQAVRMNIDHLVKINNVLKEIKENYTEFQSQFTGVDISVLQHQIPGGMLSNMESQLKQLNAYDRLDEVLAEVPRVHKEFGYPPLGTPFSQIVGTQATLNVLQGERYKMVPKESKAYMRGEYGKFPAPVDSIVQRKIIGDDTPISCRPADLIPPEWEKYKAEAGSLAKTDEDVLMYALFPVVAKKYLEGRQNAAL